MAFLTGRVWTHYDLAAPMQGDCMAHKVDRLHIQAKRVEELLHGHPIQIIALEGPGIFGLILLHIPVCIHKNFRGNSHMINQRYSDNSWERRGSYCLPEGDT